MVPISCGMPIFPFYSSKLFHFEDTIWCMEQSIPSPVVCKTVFCYEDLNYYELSLTTGVVEKTRDFQIMYWFQGCTNLVCDVAIATIFHALVHEIFVSSVWDLLRVTVLLPRFLRWLLHFLKICAFLGWWMRYIFVFVGLVEGVCFIHGFLSTFYVHITLVLICDFKRRIKSHLPFASITRRCNYSSR